MSQRSSDIANLRARDRERESVRLNRSQVAERISMIATDLTELRMLRQSVPTGSTRVLVWLNSCIDNKERELRTSARALAEGLKPKPAPDAKRQRKA